ncbi:hypothetical protein CR513_50033, partial [Mucuna pruriens]
MHGCCYLLPLFYNIRHRILDQTLYSLLPRTYGYICFVHNIACVKDKLQTKSIKCQFLGYSHTQKRNRCYSSSTNNYLSITFLIMSTSLNFPFFILHLPRLHPNP